MTVIPVENQKKVKLFFLFILKFFLFYNGAKGSGLDLEEVEGE